jgi:hypothetical protein
MPVQPEQELFAFDRAGIILLYRRAVGNTLEALMGAVVVVVDIFPHDIP